MQTSEEDLQGIFVAARSSATLRNLLPPRNGILGNEGPIVADANADGHASVNL